jgi:Fe-S oxidoreductase
MPDPTASTSLLIPGVAWLWVLTAIALVLFGARVYRLAGALARGKPEPRWDRLPARVWSVIVNVLAQRRMFDNPGVGLAHLVIFWTFLFYATSFAWNLVRGLVPALPIPYSDEVAWFTIPMLLLSLATVVALAGAAVRRYVVRPARLTQSRDAAIILSLISVLVVTFLVGQAAAAGLGGLSATTAEALYTATWWIHMITVLGFLAYLPYSKHLHLLASPFNVFTGTLERSGMPPPSEGAEHLEDFTWRQLFNGLSCAECGRCDRSCPAFAEGGAMSPQDLVHAVKLMVLGAASGDGHGSLIEAVGADAVWACTTCGACTARCPVLNEHVPLVVQMRRHLVGEGAVGQGVSDMLMGMTRYGNSFGQSPRNRAKWTRDLEPGHELKDARKEAVEYLWWVGDYASFDPRVQEVTRATARVFDRAGLDVGIVYEAEQNAGNDVRRLGEEGLFEMLRDKNREVLDGAEFRTIVTTDPHTYHVLRNEYGLDHGVRHYTEVLDDLVSSGRLPVARNGVGRVTYHDPCYLGRYNGVYEAPRHVLKALGAEVVEMPRNRSNAACCGAGGGRIWMEDAAREGERPAESRVREAAALDGVGTLVCSCPKDLVMFRDALKTTGLEGTIEVRDIAELVEDAIGVTSRSDL